jgi:hypothetical protein
MYMYLCIYTLPWGHLEMSLFLKERDIFCTLKQHQIDLKYSVDIVNVVNDYCSWKRLIFMEYLYIGVQRPLSANITPVFQWHIVLANPSLSF